MAVSYELILISVSIVSKQRDLGWGDNSIYMVRGLLAPRARTRSNKRLSFSENMSSQILITFCWNCVQ